MKIEYCGQEGERFKVKIDNGEPMLLTLYELEQLAAIDEKITQEEHDWETLRNQAAIAAMQGVMNFFGSIDYNRETIAKLAVEQADALIDKLKEK